MKAYEEFENSGIQTCDNRICPEHNNCEKCEREVGWRAALEWVLGEHGPLDRRNRNVDCARGRIENELKGK